jgi:hypothetical protein
VPADYDPKLIEEFAALIPEKLEGRSGKVFYAGRAAFGAPSPIYILGFNPGGYAEDHPDETIGQHTERVLHRYDHHWSALFDEVWRPRRTCYPKGEAPMQRRVRHPLEELGLDPRRVPMSNIIFVRSPRQAKLSRQDAETAALVWPFHLRVIDKLRIRMVLCLGQKATDYVQRQLDEREFVDAWKEKDENRSWHCEAWRSSSTGRLIVRLTHPSVADWTNPAADPSPFVRRLLDQVSSGTAGPT